MCSELPRYTSHSSVVVPAICRTSGVSYLRVRRGDHALVVRGPSHVSRRTLCGTGGVGQVRMAAELRCTAGMGAGWPTLWWRGGGWGSACGCAGFSVTTRAPGADLRRASRWSDRALCAVHRVVAGHAGVDRAGVGRSSWGAAGHCIGVAGDPEQVGAVASGLPDPVIGPVTVLGVDLSRLRDYSDTFSTWAA